MNFVLFACALLVAGATALPPNVNTGVQPNQERLITNTIRDAIRQVQNAIKDLGLDPLVIENYNFEYNIPFVVDVKLFLDNFSFIGASDIKINELDYSVLFNRLRFDIELPNLTFVVVDSGAIVDALGTKFNGELRGSLAFQGIALSGEVRVNVGIISGISIRSLDIKFRPGSIRSNIQLVVLDYDWSDDVNKLFNEDIPNVLKHFEGTINEYLTNLVRSIADAILNTV